MAEGVTIFGCVRRWNKPIQDGEVWYPNFRPPRIILSRLTRSFQMHPWKTMVRAERRWVRACPVPIYGVEDLTAQNKRAVRYPIGLFAHYSIFSSSFDYMLALAQQEKLNPIRIRGLDLQLGSLRERLCEHVGLAYWVGIARGQGLTVQIDRDCWVLKHPYDYGYDYWEERRWCQMLARGARRLKILDDGVAVPDRTVKGVSFSGRV